MLKSVYNCPRWFSAATAFFETISSGDISQETRLINVPKRVYEMLGPVHVYAFHDEVDYTIKLCAQRMRTLNLLHLVSFPS